MDKSEIIYYLGNVIDIHEEEFQEDYKKILKIKPYSYSNSFSKQEINLIFSVFNELVLIKKNADIEKKYLAYNMFPELFSDDDMLSQYIRRVVRSYNKEETENYIRDIRQILDSFSSNKFLDVPRKRLIYCFNNLNLLQDSLRIYCINEIIKSF